MLDKKVLVITTIAGSLLFGGCEHTAAPPISETYYDTDFDCNDFETIRVNMVNNMNDTCKAIQETQQAKFYTEEVIITYYTASDEECGNENGITASGTVAVEGRTIAADHLPFGTVVEIDGVQYVVEDRFGAGHTNKIDVYVENKDKAIKLGKRKIEVKIYGNTR